MKEMKLDEVFVRASLERIVNTPTGGEKERLVRELVTYLHSKEAFAVWGQEIARKYRHLDKTEDLIQQAVEFTLVVAIDLTPARLAAAQSGVSLLYYECRRRLRDWLDGPAVTFATGMSGVMRRTRLATAAQAKLTDELGREPTPREVVDYVEKTVSATRTNPKKQGVFVTTADLDRFQTNTLNIDLVQEGVGEDVPLQAQVTLTVIALQRLAKELFPDLVQLPAVVSWWSGVVADGEFPSKKRLRDRFDGVTEESAKQYLAAVNTVLDTFRERADVA